MKCAAVIVKYLAVKIVHDVIPSGKDSSTVVVKPLTVKNTNRSVLVTNLAGKDSHVNLKEIQGSGGSL